MNRSYTIAFVVVCLLSSLSSLPAAADDGEFWDAAVASLVYTKKMEKSHLQLKAGGRYLMQVDNLRVPPADWAAVGELTYYGLHVKRYRQLFSLYGQAQLGMHDNGGGWRLDGYRARMTVYHYLNGGAFSVGIFRSERQKAADEEFSAAFRSFEYATGGAMKAFVFALTTSALGYEYRNYFTRPDYHGFFIFELGLDMGVVFAKDARVSYEIKLGSDVAFSWPRQKDFEIAAEMVWHFNNRVIPFDLSIDAGYDYYNEDDDTSVTYDFWHTGAMLGARF
ncbi:MAG: hypothetical protein JXX29_11050 [Deltaproteobacteria bacterium]|nr:hypothetical protein [Deltaproteobacteria bacterium]MBN2672207.1 hypothetical protein [Deltaproteobacteria bacterium]